MTIVGFIAKFAWSSLFVLVWLRAFGLLAAKPGLTWGALAIFGVTALIATFFYIGMESMLWDRMYPKKVPPKKSELGIPAEEL